MTQVLLFSLTAAAVFGIGLHGFLIHGHLLRKMLAANIMGSAIFLLLIALARRDPTLIDPVPHAMVLTGIVIAVCATAFALALLRRLHQETGRVNLAEDDRPANKDASGTDSEGSP